MATLDDKAHAGLKGDVLTGCKRPPRPRRSLDTAVTVGRRDAAGSGDGRTGSKGRSSVLKFSKALADKGLPPHAHSAPLVGVTVGAPRSLTFRRGRWA